MRIISLKKWSHANNVSLYSLRDWSSVVLGSNKCWFVHIHSDSKSTFIWLNLQWAIPENGGKKKHQKFCDNIIFQSVARRSWLNINASIFNRRIHQIHLVMIWLESIQTIWLWPDYRKFFPFLLSHSIPLNYSWLGVYWSCFLLFQSHLRRVPLFFRITWAVHNCRIYRYANARKKSVGEMNVIRRTWRADTKSENFHRIFVLFFTPVMPPAGFTQLTK